jgi:hypothetical protein
VKSVWEKMVPFTKRNFISAHTRAGDGMKLAGRMG